jgi:hypothetical protein
MARLRAVVVIQPPGFGGRPSAGLGEVDVADDPDQGRN